MYLHVRITVDNPNNKIVCVKGSKIAHAHVKLYNSSSIAH